MNLKFDMKLSTGQAQLSVDAMLLLSELAPKI